MERYVLGIEFSEDRHCLYCPVRDKETECCNIQVFGDVQIEFDSWEEQMENCPLQSLEVENEN